MKISHILMVILFSVGMGFGQLLLKFSAKRQLIHSSADWMHRIFSLFTDWSFLLGIVFYALLLIFWIWILTFLPLSRAYPFTILSFVVAAVGSAFFFQETITLSLVFGLLIIGIGLIVLSLG